MIAHGKACAKYGSVEGIIDMEQNPGHSTTSLFMPCLTQKLAVWGLREERPLLDEERWLVHGVPALAKVREQTGLNLLFPFESLSPRVACDIVGNGQCPVVMGAVQLWYLSCTLPREGAPVVRAMPPAGVAESAYAYNDVG